MCSFLDSVARLHSRYALLATLRNGVAEPELNGEGSCHLYSLSHYVLEWYSGLDLQLQQLRDSGTPDLKERSHSNTNSRELTSHTASH